MMLCSYIITLIAIYYCWMHPSLLIAWNNVKLFTILRDRKLCPIVLRLLMNMYINQTIQVRWNNTLSNVCGISNGVKQGGCRSPT